MIMRYYKKVYLDKPESEMKVRDGIVDGVVTVLAILSIRAFFNMVIV